MDYIDFHLKIGPRVAESQYAVAARSPSVGEASGVFTQPLTDEQLELFVLKVGLARRGVRRIHSPEWRAAQDFGQKLFRALFTEEIRAAYLASQNDAMRQGKGLRLQLTLEAPELANYPWEFLYNPSSSQFLSLFEDTPVLRYIELARPIVPLTVAPPLRILAVASSPKDYEQLDLAQERRNLSTALDPLLQAGLIELDWLGTATLDALRAQLLKRPYHIFHFIGHGGFDASAQDGILIFENANQYSNRVSGERLAVILGNHRTLRLAILNACEGARTSEQDPFAGTAMTLVRTGNLPAVIAMQFEISDNAAIDFASGFYAAIAAGRPVDAAVSQGRQAIFTDNNDVEWSTPVLYLRAPNGLIFEVDTSRAAEDARRIAAEQAEKERLAREKLEAERAVAEQAERERLENIRLEQERLTREKLEAERAAAEQIEKERLENARLEQERIQREKLEVERAAAERALKERRENERLEQERLTREQAEAKRIEQERIANVRAAQEQPQPLASAPVQTVPSLGAALASPTELKVPLLLGQVVWVLVMGFVAISRDSTTNVLIGAVVAVLLMGFLYWWGRSALSPSAHRILLIGMGAGFAVQGLAIFLFVQPVGNAIYESVSPVLNLPEASQNFIMTAFRSALFAMIGSVTGLKVIAWQSSSASRSEPITTPSTSSGRERVDLQETRMRRPADALEMLPTEIVLTISGLLLALSSGLSGASSLALFYGGEEQPGAQIAGIIFAIGALLFGAISARILGMAIARLTRFDRTSTLILAFGELGGLLLGIVSGSLQWDVFGVYLLISLLAGGSIALALLSSNRQLAGSVLGIIAAGWVVGFLIQGAATVSAYPSLMESVWDWLLPLEESIGIKPLYVIQIGIIGFFFGGIAPLIGIPIMNWQLRRPAPKE